VIAETPRPEGRPATEASESAPVDDWPTPSAPAPELPPIAAKADDLEAIKKAVDDAASVGGGLWLSYLFVLFYLAVATGAVTHADLFLEKPVKLPFLGIELPLLAFFALAPILFIVVHAYTLVHLVMLTDKAKRFDEELRDQIGWKDGLSEIEVERRKDIRTRLRRQLPSNIFIYFLVGPKDLREKAFGRALRAIAWVSLVVAPVLMLLLVQLQFLPYHYGPITWSHRGALLADLILVYWLWCKILSRPEAEPPNESPSVLTAGFTPVLRKSIRFDASGIGVALLVLVVLFSWFVATFPGEWQEVSLSNSEGTGAPFSLHEWIFNSPFDFSTGRRRNVLSATLVLPGLNIYDGLKIEDPNKTLWRKYVFVAGRRDLQGAIFNSALLPNIDFTGAQLQGASFIFTQLQDTSFVGAQLQGTFFQQAQLQGVNLSGAQLQGASLASAQLQGANLQFAQLPGGNLQYAHLQGASLNSANLDAASLDYAQLQGALLQLTQLRGASLEGAQLNGAWLLDAQLQGASLIRADLRAADLTNALLWRARGRTPLKGDDARIESINLPDARGTWQPLWRDGQLKVGEWNERAYQTVRSSLNSVEVASLRNNALDRLRQLDCENPDPAPASCDRSATPTAETLAWQAAVEGARVDQASYYKALAITLERLVCSGAKDSIDVLRGLLLGPSPRLDFTGPEAPTLFDHIMKKECLVSDFLTDADRSELLDLKQGTFFMPGG
jgi:uncharacterized protein YjbI with pentapeptide repeats